MRRWTDQTLWASSGGSPTIFYEEAEKHLRKFEANKRKDEDRQDRWLRSSSARDAEGG